MLDFNKMNIIGKEVVECAGSTTETVFTGSITGMQELIPYHVFNKEFTKKEKVHYICIKETTRDSYYGIIKRSEIYLRISDNIEVLKVIPAAHGDDYLLRIFYKDTCDWLDVILTVDQIKKLLINEDIDSLLLLAELDT